ncbi:hypothetical protein JCGZ_27095 [Jatropha curcas]|uniref:Uncharacterized protein n=1 Tax=Jatropha curcas TaxID=180498 RepID=A0A067JVA9_JATCU|nr:hypothetical protein JCGZ_27095 [Jatropha curcas]
MSRHCFFPTNVNQYECVDDLVTKNLRYPYITELKGAYAIMEVQKIELEEALKSMDATMKDQESQYKAKIDAYNVELEELQRENRS